MALNPLEMLRFEVSGSTFPLKTPLPLRGGHSFHARHTDI